MMGLSAITRDCANREIILRGESKSLIAEAQGEAAEFAEKR
jgi:hypothetical protein